MAKKKSRKRKSNLLYFLLGAATFGALKVLAPHLKRSAKPLLREGYKAGLKGLDRLREVREEVLEDLEDVAAEARTEFEAERE